MNERVDQIAELRKAIAGDDACLLPVMPSWWHSLSDEEKSEALKRAATGPDEPQERGSR